MKDRSGSALTSSRRNASHYVALHVRGSQIARSARRPTGGITHGVVMDVPAHVYASQDIADYLSLIETVRQKLDQARQDPPDCHGSGLQAVAIARDRVDPDHGLLMRLGLSSRRPPKQARRDHLIDDGVRGAGRHCRRITSGAYRCGS